MKEKKLNKNNGFKIPEDYFNHLEDRIMNRIDLDAQKITNKKNGFTVPDQYFNSIEDNFFAKIKEDESQTKIISIFNTKTSITVAAIAASLVLLFSLSNITILDKSEEINFSTLDIVDISTYIEQGNIELSDSELADIIGEEIDFTSNFENSPIDDEAVLDYLDLNELENEIIYFD